jgi:phosphatidylinositol dimannoside acyltransferase
MTAIAIPAARPRRTIGGRVAASGLLAFAAVLRLLPDRALHRLAHWLGATMLYRVQRQRRALVKANLGRIVAYLARPEATDEAALNRLVQQAFGHYVRSYLEGAIVPAYDGPHLAQRVQPDDSLLVEQVMGKPGDGPRKLLFVGLHFGAIELPALWAVRVRGLDLVSPMETVANPDLQSYFQRTRSKTGLQLIPTRGAARVLTNRLDGGHAVAVVADRVVAGSGARVELFGAAARLPLGPAVLALETGAPAWAAATRRTGWGDYRARLEQIELPAAGTRRERLAGFMANQARAFEQLIADAPEQWWAIFFPIWEDGR